MIDKNNVIELVKTKGPVLPVHISKNIGTNILLASAILSELVSNKQVKITNTKIGSSPLYYFPGQEYKLQSLYKHLNEKDRRAYDLLRSKKILRDKSLNPIERVSLREIKDFATQLNVSGKAGQEIFWKWFLLSNDDATRIIKSALTSDIPKEVPKQETIQKPVQQETQLPQPTQQVQTPQQQSQQNTVQQSIQSPLPSQPAEIKKEEPKINTVPKPTTQVQEKHQQIINQEKPVNVQPEQHKEIKEPIKEKIEEKPVKKEPVEKPKPIIEDKEIETKTKPDKKELSEKDKTVSDKFFSKIKYFLGRKEIKLINFEIVRKESEIDLIIEIPSAVGILKYYCKARNKKRINDSDLSSAYVKGESNKLPVLFLTEGVLTKKSQEMLHKEFKNINFKKI
jgi:hypothetical protein